MVPWVCYPAAPPPCWCPLELKCGKGARAGETRPPSRSMLRLAGPPAPDPGGLSSPRPDPPKESVRVWLPVVRITRSRFVKIQAPGGPSGLLFWASTENSARRRVQIWTAAQARPAYVRTEICKLFPVDASSSSLAGTNSRCNRISCFVCIRKARIIKSTKI